MVADSNCTSQDYILICVIPARPTKAGKLTPEEMYSLLLPIDSRWKEFGQKMGCAEDLLDEIYTNNETNRDCLRNLTDVYQSGKSRESIAMILEEIGETELSENCKQGDGAWLCITIPS